MKLSKLKKLIIVGVLGIVGMFLLFQSSPPAPETLSRQLAIQNAYAPNRQGNDVDNPVTASEENIITYSAAVSPVAVNINTVSNRVNTVDELQLAYEAGELDLSANEGPVSDAVYQALLAESAQQRFDASVQNYSPQQERLHQFNSDIQTADELTSGVSFKAIDYTQSQQGVPPDPDIMVGKDHVVVGVNTSFQIFDKSGNSLYGPTLYASFWGSSCGSGSDVVMFDPFSQYDEENGRYVMGITAYDPGINGGDNGWACIAVSQTDSAMGNWWLYSFDGNPGAGSEYFFDYPHIGVGQDALYLSANMFGSTFVRNQIFAYDKNAMYAGQSAQSIKFNLDASYFSLQPAKLKGFTTGGWPTNADEPHYFIDAQWGNNQNTLTIWQLTDPWQNPSFTQAGTVTVNNYSLPISQPQLDGNNLQGNDNRLLDVEYWGGKLWTTHTISCNPESGTVNCIAWYEIDMTSGSPALIQQGTFASNREYRSFPDIGVNACGDMLIGYTKMSTSMYPSVYVAGRQTNDTAGLLKNETLVHAGETAYTAYDPIPHRWGDYTGMALDPDGETFWYVGEYSRSQTKARWSTWVSSHDWAACDPNSPPEPTVTPEPNSTPLPEATSAPGPSPTDNHVIFFPIFMN